MISNLSRRDLPAKQTIKNDNTNYKELYLQCKKNVAIFMKHVDGQLTAILKNHEQEKKKLKAEIEKLKNQLKQQNDTSIVYAKTLSLSKRNISQGKINTQSSVSRQIIDESLGEFSHLNLKTIYSERKNESELTCSEQKAKSKLMKQSEKENLILPDNINEDDLQMDMKMMNSSRRDKRLRERKPIQRVEKVDNIKDFLKDIRGKLNTERPASQPKEKEVPTINIITPGMFTSRGTK